MNRKNTLYRNECLIRFLKRCDQEGLDSINEIRTKVEKKKIDCAKLVFQKQSEELERKLENTIFCKNIQYITVYRIETDY